MLLHNCNSDSSPASYLHCQITAARARVDFDGAAEHRAKPSASANAGIVALLTREHAPHASIAPREIPKTLIPCGDRFVRQFNESTTKHENTSFVARHLHPLLFNPSIASRFFFSQTSSLDSLVAA